MNRYLKYLLTIGTVCMLACGVSSRNTVGKDLPTMVVEYVGAEVIADDGLTRMQLRLIGQPHTAARIDSVYIFGGDGAGIAATDIDGVDFGRWFQWEDEAVIDIELDIPGTVHAGGETLVFYGPRGNVSCKTAPRK
ncbi:MAG: hypothetical protein K2J17_02875 [Paramuribaculum sp.]|nr:hypothetical protein [Paramuribaculum sp.]